MLHLAQRGFIFAQVVEDGEHLRKDAVFLPGKRLGGFLRQVTQPGAARNLHAARAGLGQSSQNQQQGGFAHAVGANQPHLATIGNAAADARENVKRAKRLANVVCRQKCHSLRLYRTYEGMRSGN